MNYKTYNFNSLTSTQDKAREFAGKGIDKAVIAAEIQTRGRGRFGRKWHSSKGGLWMTILLKPDNITYLQYLTFAASVAVVKTIKESASLNVNIKWPNDVHYKEKKLCGILTESIFGKNNYVAIGIGLNVNQNSFDDGIKDIATSLKIVRKRNFDIKKLIQTIADKFFHFYDKYYDNGRHERILSVWKKYCDTLGSDVKVISKSGVISGRAIGVDKDCSLLLMIKDGTIRKIIEGDVRVRN